LEEKNFVKIKYNLPENYFLFVGDLVAHKNIIKIIEALPHLPEEKRFQLIIVGKETKYKEILVSKVSQEKLNDKVKFIEYIDTIDMPAVYQMAKILVGPSLYEGFGIPIIEALFSKLPVITSKDGCFHEAGGDSSIYINPKSSDEIASSIYNVLNDSKLYSKIQNEGFEYVKKIHIEATTKRLMNFYCKML
jgi:glycosyltransferase involved in cell wall biosynthesis